MKNELLKKAQEHNQSEQVEANQEKETNTQEEKSGFDLSVFTDTGTGVGDRIPSNLKSIAMNVTGGYSQK